MAFRTYTLLGIYIGHDKDQAHKLNWTIKLENISLLLQSWKKRKLTLFGKVAILKQLALPKILFSACMLHTPEYIVKELNQIFFNFLWGNREFVKRDVMFSRLNDGGINMFDVESMFTAVKCSWAVRLLNASDNEIWPTIAKYVYKLDKDNFLLLRLNCTNEKKANHFLQNISPFYRQVITCFNRAKCIDYDIFCQNILEQPLFGNDHIVCNSQHGKNMMLMFPEWVKCGLVKVGNLRFKKGILDENFIYQTEKMKTNIISEISLIKTGLKHFNTFIGDNQPDLDSYIPVFLHKDVVIDMFTDCKSKFFYEKVIDHKIASPVRTVSYWKEYFDDDDIDFKAVFTNKLNLKDKKLAEFNFKILHRYLPCNYNLYKWKKRQDDICSLCGVKEDIVHLLFNCVFARIIWDKINENSHFQICAEDVILGYRLSKFDTFIVSTVAYFIFKNWLKYSYENIPRDPTSAIQYLIIELQYTIKIYSALKCQDLCRHLKITIDSLGN